MVARNVYAKYKNLPLLSWSLYKDKVIKIVSQPTGIMTKQTFRENRNLLALVKTRIASLPARRSHTTDSLLFTEMSRNAEEKILTLIHSV